MKTILFPLSYVEDSGAALKELVLFLGKVEDTFQVYLLDTYMVPISSPDELIFIHDELRRQSREKLQKEADLIKGFAQAGKVSFEVISQMGTPVNAVSRLVKEKQIDAVVMAIVIKHQHIVKQHEFLTLLGRLNCPIILLPLETGK